MTSLRSALARHVLEGGHKIAPDKPVSWPIRGYYGLGQAAESIKNWGFSTLLLIYYNQVLGVSGTLASLALFIALAFDAFSDPAVGSWSDNLRSRYGRRHPAMLGAIIPLPIFFFLLFWPPAHLSSFWMFVWLTVFTILTRLSLTFFHVPYLALGAELTKDYHERTMLVMIRTGMGYLSSLIVITVAFSYFFVSSEETPDPLLTREPYFAFAIVSSIVMSLMMFVSIWGTRGTIHHLSGRSEPRQAFRLIQIWDDLKAALKSISFRALIAGVFLLYIYLGVHNALSTHLQTFYWKLDTGAIKTWQMSSVVGGVLGVPLVPLANRLLDKKVTVVWGVTLSCIMGTAPVLLNLVGLMPDDPAILVPLLSILAALASFTGVQALISSGSMLGDIADEHEYEFGKRQEGIYFSTFSLAAKCTSGAGTLIAGIALDLIRFPVNSSPDTVPPEVLTRFGLVYGVVALIAVAALWVFRPYHLNKARHEVVFAALQERARAAATGPEEERGADPGSG